MVGGSGPKARKSGQLIFADNSLEQALSKKPPEAVLLNLYVPTTPSSGGCRSPCTPAPKGENLYTMGGFMAVPIVGASFGSTVVTQAQVKSYCDRVCADRVLLVFDTGSEAYFVQDDTGCAGSAEGAQVESFLEFCKIGGLVEDPSKGMSLTLGEMEDTSSPAFTLEHPAEWFMLKPAAIAAGAPPINATARTQTIIAGNFWLQALAVTWNARARTIAFSHLDAAGARCAKFQGKSASAEEKEEVLIELATSTQRPLPSGVRWDGHTRLSGREEVLAGGAGGTPTYNTAVDLRFMQSVEGRLDAYGDKILTQETTDPQAISQFCLDAVVTLTDGSTVNVCQPFDTGSEICLVTEQHILPVEGNAMDSACLNAGTVASVFRSVAGPAAGVLRCTSETQAQCDNSCCRNCCLAGSTTADTTMQCSVAYCTGLLSYRPLMSKITFPLEVKTQSLTDVKVLLGSATPRCLPAAATGVWGSWFWTQPLTNGKDTQGAPSSLPHYILSHLGAAQDKQSNLTLRVWRSDLQSAGGGGTSVGKPPLSDQQRLALTRRRPAWAGGGNAPASAPVAPWPSPAPLAPPPTSPPQAPPVPAPPIPAPPTPAPPTPSPAASASPSAVRPPQRGPPAATAETCEGGTVVHVNVSNANSNELSADRDVRHVSLVASATELAEEKDSRHLSPASRKELLDTVRDVAVGANENSAPAPSPPGGGWSPWLFLALAIAFLVLLAAGYAYFAHSAQTSAGSGAASAAAAGPVAQQPPFVPRKG